MNRPAAVAVLLALLVGCTSKEVPKPSESIAPLSVIGDGTFVKGSGVVLSGQKNLPMISRQVITQVITGLKSTAVSKVMEPQVSKVAPSGLHPLLREQLNANPTSDSRIPVLVTFADDFTSADAEVLRAGDVNRIIQLRTSKNASSVMQLKAINAEILQEFWITKAIKVRVPLKSLPALAKIAGVEAVDPEVLPIAPPAYGDLETGRNLIHSDFLFNLNLPVQTRIAVLDGSLWTGHSLLQGLDIAIFNCVTNQPTCVVGSSAAPSNLSYHATAVHSILSGNLSLGFASRGVTRYPIDHYDIYADFFPPGSGTPVEGLDLSAALRAFQTMATGARVRAEIVVAEIQACPGTTSLTNAANNYALSGRVVVSAAGNYGTGGSTGNYQNVCPNNPSPSTIASPAEGKAVIAVGAVGYNSLTTEFYQSRGWVENRPKPDIQGPTGLAAASTSSPTATGPFYGTSGSTPFVGGMAALMYSNQYMTAGYTNAWLIASGLQDAIVINTTDPQGSGMIDLTRGGPDVDVFITNLQVPATGQGSEVVLQGFNRAYKKVRAAIWWAEGPSNHDDVDLVLTAPDGRTTGSFLSGSVFEKAVINNVSAVGTWKVRINTYSSTHPQSGIVPIREVNIAVIGDL